MMDRIIGRIEGDRPGPLIICIAGLHGNEQIGIHAFRNVLSGIQNHSIPFKGKLVGIAGNLKAIAANRRFFDFDMNRIWNHENISSVIQDELKLGAESEELKALYQTIAEESKGDYPIKVMADLHATSSDNGNFIVVPEAEGDHPVIAALKLPVVLEMEKYLKGTLLAYYFQKGFVSFAFEGGMIGTNEVYRLHTSGLWEVLEKAGAITKHDHEEEDHYSSQLQAISQSLPSKVIAKYHHSVKPTDGFTMLPGFKNFQPIRKGQQLAITSTGAVLAPIDGLIFMPLYQSEGEDGFFIVQEVIENILSV